MYVIYTDIGVRHMVRRSLTIAQIPRFRSCPKCKGEYRRDGTLFHCYQCSFEWEFRDRVDEVLARARYRVQPGPDTHVFWDERLDREAGA